MIASMIASHGIGETKVGKVSSKRARPSGSEGDEMVSFVGSIDASIASLDGLDAGFPALQQVIEAQPPPGGFE